MFQTASHAEHPLMSAIAGEGQQVWTYVNLAANVPWFYASYFLHTPEGDIWENIMLSTVEQVADLMAQDKHMVKMKSLMLVSPSRLNKSNGWLMEPLAKIWDARIGETDHHAQIFELAGGTKYIDSFQDLELTQLCDVRCIVRFRRK